MSRAVAPLLRAILLELIDEPELPSRSTMDDQLLDDLVASILQNGFFGAIVVVVVGVRYRVVAGHRRWHAARRAGLTEIPCSIYPTESDALEAIQHAENTRREDLNVVDEAIWFQQLFDKYPQEGIDGLARRVRESESYVNGRLELLRGDADVLAALKAGEIKIGVAQVLNKVGHDQYRRMYLRMAVENGVSIGTARNWLTEYKRIHEPAIGDEPVIAAGSASGPTAQHSYFACVVCQRDDDLGQMQHIAVHSYCNKSRLAPAVAAAREGIDYVQFPRTRADAVALLNRITDRFPELLEEPAASA